jgi:prepilin-type processing-associated H-X9-DG protein
MRTSGRVLVTLAVLILVGQQLGCIPVNVTRAREEAREATCVSNLKQVELATLMFAQDHQGKLPAGDWPSQLSGYVVNTAIYTCPSASGQPVSYVLNQAVAGKKLSTIVQPQQTVLLFEADSPPSPPVGGSALVGTGRHQGAVVVGFVDGHVETYTPGEARRLLSR